MLSCASVYLCTLLIVERIASNRPVTVWRSASLADSLFGT